MPVGPATCYTPQILVGLPAAARAAVLPSMSTKSRHPIYGGRIIGAKVHAESARQRAKEAAREADAADCLLWSEQMAGYGGPAQPSPTIAQCLNGGYGWLEVECHRCKTRASIPLDAVRRPRDTPGPGCTGRSGRNETFSPEKTDG